MFENLIPWALFILFIVVMLAIDLGVFNRKDHEVKVKEALAWSGVWVCLALLFNLGIYFWRGQEIAVQFFTGYVIEKSLSIDNIFVFLQVFAYFSVPAKYQHKILFWGVLGAIIMRAIFIGAGVALITQFHWVIYVFGAFLIFTGAKMVFSKDKEEVHPEKNLLIKLLRRLMPISNNYDDGRFFVRKDGVLMATSLMVVLMVIETTDVIFAVDSIPAILAITTDSFIVFSSNLFAIMGLRSLFFALAGVIKRFHYIHYGLAAILAFVGAKMLVSNFYKLPSVTALTTIAAILTLSMIASVIWPRRSEVPERISND
ncbi:MAG: tellurium resistance protein TerC [Deltaproteobacteria bacterium RIFCSPLOWO2_02_FULL_53_8]|nr:MAG: tellurium resistance protein TerC [Deltaproteobacteria bacterium RIFCSPLOWO2_02_FULL_53_8]